ncbi:hypothetical protein BU17DRAFT_76352 [Hysterangium stoloniferum]|nr:hypothetical protein BU17DRAFT_76352 [Hysterangium stoloniferum]
MLRRLELMFWAIISPELIVYWAARHKGDALSKRLVIVQTTWFLIQCISRKAQGLDTTQIELLTLAFATLNGILYFLWWDKPLNIQCPVPVQLLETPIKSIEHDTLPDTDIPDNMVEERYTTSRPLKTFEGKPCLSVEYGRMRVPLLYALGKDGVGPRKIDIPLPVLGITLLWRVCSILVTIIPGLFAPVFGLVGDWGNSDLCLRTGSALLIAILPVYILARLGLLVGAVISLRALPPKAYANVDWTSFLPHI